MGLLRRIRAILEQSPSERDPRDVVIENGRTARDVVVSAGCRTATVSRGQTGRGYIVRAFLARRGTESETTRAHRLSLIREVCRFLALDDPRTFVPASRFLGIHRRTRVPRVLSLEEGRRFLDACDTLDRQRSSPRRERVLRTLLVLLYLTVLRSCCTSPGCGPARAFVSPWPQPLCSPRTRLFVLLRSGVSGRCSSSSTAR